MSSVGAAFFVGVALGIFIPVIVELEERALDYLFKDRLRASRLTSADRKVMSKLGEPSTSITSNTGSERLS